MAKFLLAFCIMYYGTIAWIGITSPGGYYSAFADKYLDYVSLMRYLLLHSSAFILDVLDYKVYITDTHSIKLLNGSGVHVGYDCIGYGVMIFWVAFIFANKAQLQKKIQWIAAGLLAIWIVNILRVSLMVIGIKQNWASPFDLDNHTLFNIAAYAVIFTMIFLFDRSQNKRLPDKNVSGYIRRNRNIE